MCESGDPNSCALVLPAPVKLAGIQTFIRTSSSENSLPSFSHPLNESSLAHLQPVSTATATATRPSTVYPLSGTRRRCVHGANQLN